MTEALRRYLDLALPHMHWILLVMGISMLLFGYFVGTQHSDTNEFFRTVAIAIFSAGVFSVALKSFQFSQVFLADLEKVVLAEQHLKNRRDLPEIWARVTKALHSNNFPDIDPGINQKILDDYFPSNHAYYYKDVKRIVSLSWHDQEKSIVKVETDFSGLIIPAEGASVVPYRRTFESFEIAEVSELVKAESLVVGDDELLESMTIERKAGDARIEGLVEYVISGELPISGPTRYQSRNSTYLDLTDDNILQFAGLSYIDGLDVQVVWAPGLTVIFNPFGTDDYLPLGGLSRDEESQRRMMRRETKELLFANQGYILIVIPQERSLARKPMLEEYSADS